MEELSEAARAIRAAYTIIPKDGKHFRYNTDWVGVLNSLKRHGIPHLCQKTAGAVFGGVEPQGLPYRLFTKGDALHVEQQLFKILKIQAHFPKEFGIEVQDSDAFLASSDAVSVAGRPF